jgi:hypothetical protein
MQLEPFVCNSLEEQEVAPSSLPELEPPDTLGFSFSALEPDPEDEHLPSCDEYEAVTDCMELENAFFIDAGQRASRLSIHFVNSV